MIMCVDVFVSQPATPLINRHYSYKHRKSLKMGTNAIHSRNYKNETASESEKYSSSEDDISSDDCLNVASRQDRYMPSIQRSTEEDYVNIRYSGISERCLYMIGKFIVN